MKPWLKAIIIVAVIAALTAGGIFLYAHFAGNHPVEVTKIGYRILSWMPNQSDIYGFVVSDDSQALIKEKDKTVVEVYVHEGDSVKIGDPLVRYDSTLDNLTLEEKLLEREKLYNTLQEDYAEYKRWARLEYERTVPTYTPSPSPTPRGKTNAAPRISIARDLTNPVSGSGTSVDPFRYSIADQERINAAFIALMLDLAKNNSRSFYALLTAPKSETMLVANPDETLSFRVKADDPDPLQPDFNSSKGGDGSKQKPFLFSYASDIDVPTTFLKRFADSALAKNETVCVTLLASGFRAEMEFQPDGGISFVVSIIEITPSPSPSPTPTPSPAPTDTPEPSETPYIPPYYGPGKAEREELARQAAQKIRAEEVQYRQLSLDIQKLLFNGADGIVFSTVEGTVSKSVDPSTVQDGEMFLEVRGGTGLHVVSTLGEMDLINYPVGTEMTGFSYESGMDVQVRITDVGSMPVSTNYMNGGNPNSSGYLVTMEFLSDATPKVGEYIEFTYRPGAESETTYLFEAFIREIDGQDCIYLVKDDHLVKTPVTVGKRFDQYLELLDIKLSPEDYIAFPYDKNARDGAPVEYPSESATVIW